MTTLAQRRRTYDRLHLFFEMYDLPHCLVELERAGRKTLETNGRRPANIRRAPVSRKRVSQ